ncbi:MAG: TonB-dependent receptor, partial [Bacteroidaceae bacterium]
MKTTYYRLLVLFCLLCIIQTAGAQEKKKVTGTVVNLLTGEPIAAAKVELLNSDSILVDSTTTSLQSIKGKSYARFVFPVSKDGKYIIRCSHKDYETGCNRISLKFHGEATETDLGYFYLDKIVKDADHQLKEVTVSATKVKFYLDGDTTVYNADAFQLAEGSMLDALIKQLPGVELKGNQIYVNGKRVSSLLLNGSSFFKGNNKVMLDNLPSYMVTSVKVFKKESDIDRLRGRSIEEDKQLVMDVRLKKKYSIGWIANAEVGSGSEDRYLSRLFVSRFTPHTNVSLFGNMNNLNEDRTPGKTGEWTPSDMSNGLLATKMGGFNYNVEPENKELSFSGNVQLSHSDTDNKTNVSYVNFLSGGDNYGRSQSISNSCKTSFSTDHTIHLEKEKKYDVSISPSLNYNKNTNLGSGVSGTFSEDPSKYILSGLLDSLNAPNAGALLRRIAINRSVVSSMENGHDFSSSVRVSSSFKLKRSYDLISFDATGKYSNVQNESFSHSRLDYPSNASSSTDYRNKYYCTPTRSYNYSAKISYERWLSRDINITPFYEYGQSYSSKEQSLYRLDRLTGWGENGAVELGELPSVSDSLLSALDAKNSYYSQQHDYSHQFGNDFSWRTRRGNKYLSISFSLKGKIEKSNLSYQRAALDTAFSHRMISFLPGFFIYRTNQTKKMKNNFQSYYYANSNIPTMTYFLNVRDDSNPLSVFLGNANLKNTHSHQLFMHYDIQWTNQKSMYWNANYYILQNYVTMGSVYNKSTGASIYTPDNVNGNWQTFGEFNYTLPLDKAKRVMFSTYSKVEFAKSVSLILVSGDTTSSRNKVGSLYTTQSFKVDYQINNKVTVGAKVKGIWTHATSARKDFTTINAADFNYGVSGQVELPWNLQFSTDLTQFSRRGYESSSMNTNELVWNARLAKRYLHGN